MTSILEKIILGLLSSQLGGWHKGSIAEQRARQEKSARFFRVPTQVQCRPISAAGISAEWITGPEPEAATILYLHGGAYALGSINTHRELAARLAIASQCSVLIINYRLAPENPYPAALEDALTAYRWLISENHEPSRVFIAGDSAGGGLAVAALLALRDTRESLPAGALCFSPWLDLTQSGDTYRTNEKLDPILNRVILEGYARYYIGTEAADNPYISPLHADLRGLPPILLHCGKNEVLLGDSIRFCEKARQAGVKVTFRAWDDMIHEFQIIPLLPQAKESLQQAAEFINGQTRIHHD